MVNNEAGLDAHCSRALRIDTLVRQDLNVGIQDGVGSPFSRLDSRAERAASRQMPECVSPVRCGSSAALIWAKSSSLARLTTLVPGSRR
jgi:hypothetical protein